jgi:hypothetical protein
VEQRHRPITQLAQRFRLVDGRTQRLDDLLGVSNHIERHDCPLVASFGGPPTERLVSVD